MSLVHVCLCCSFVVSELVYMMYFPDVCVCVLVCVCVCFGVCTDAYCSMCDKSDLSYHPCILQFLSLCVTSHIHTFQLSDFSLYTHTHIHIFGRTCTHTHTQTPTQTQVHI